MLNASSATPPVKEHKYTKLLKYTTMKVIINIGEQIKWLNEYAAKTAAAIPKKIPQGSPLPPKKKAGTALQKLKAACYILRGYTRQFFLPDEFCFLGFPINLCPSCGIEVAQCIEILTQKGYTWSIAWMEELSETQQQEYITHLKGFVEQLKPMPLSRYALLKKLENPSVAI